MTDTLFASLFFQQIPFFNVDNNQIVSLTIHTFIYAFACHKCLLKPRILHQNACNWLPKGLHFKNVLMIYLNIYDGYSYKTLQFLLGLYCIFFDRFFQVPCSLSNILFNVFLKRPLPIAELGWFVTLY